MPTHPEGALPGLTHDYYSETAEQRGPSPIPKDGLPRVTNGELTLEEKAFALRSSLATAIRGDQN